MNERCGRMAGVVDALLDGELDPAAHVGALAHADACGDCGATLRAAQGLAARLAALPRRLEPEHDQWPVIAARLARRRPARGRSRAFAAVAAAAVLAVFGLATLLPGGTPDAGGAVVEVPVDPSGQVSGEALLESRVDLSTMTVSMLQANLALLDRALHDISSALELDPSNPQLQRQLHQTYRGQVELLDTLRRAPRGT